LLLLLLCERFLPGPERVLVGSLLGALTARGLQRGGFFVRHRRGVPAAQRPNAFDGSADERAADHVLEIALAQLAGAGHLLSRDRGRYHPARGADARHGDEGVEQEPRHQGLEGCRLEQRIGGRADDAGHGGLGVGA
jgi:hypothetical protein